MSSDHEKMLEYVYIPYDNIYGTVVRYGAYSSLIEYYEGGIGYTVEVPNDEYRVVYELGVGYLSDEEDTEKYIEEEEE